MRGDLAARTDETLAVHGLSLPEYELMCAAGYRVTLASAEFVVHAFAVWEGDPRGHSSISELSAALERLRSRGMMVCLTEADLREDAERRRASPVPEVVDVGYDVGHVDFTHPGYALYRDVVQAIHGDAFLLEADAGFNLDSEAGQFDVFAPTAEICQRLMDEIQGDGDSYTGIAGTTMVGREGPRGIGEWKPNRFVLRTSGYHGILRYVAGGTEHGP